MTENNEIFSEKDVYNQTKQEVEKKLAVIDKICSLEKCIKCKINIKGICTGTGLPIEETIKKINELFKFEVWLMEYILKNNCYPDEFKNYKFQIFIPPNKRALRLKQIYIQQEKDAELYEKEVREFLKEKKSV